MSVESLPDFPISTNGEFGSRFRSLGTKGYRAAARHVRDLPYGRNSDRADFRLVLKEGRGTCSTKHALLAALAGEHDAGVELRIGLYLMDASNTPGVAPILRRHDLPGLPEAHCYLAYRGARVDVTGVEGTIEDFLYEETIDPAQIGAYKVDLHKEFLRRWAAERGLNPERVWRIREECIGALSGSGVA